MHVTAHVLGRRYRFVKAPLSFETSLGAKNGVLARTYQFRVVHATDTSGSYSDVMIKDCGKIGMKPVCDHPSYCKSDGKAIYIGQDSHIAYSSTRSNSALFPTGIPCYATPHHAAVRRPVDFLSDVSNGALLL